MDHQQLALAVRYVHVAAMATAFGGALLVTWLAWRLPSARIVDVALRYEQLFWLALGVLVMTGVGNPVTRSPRRHRGGAARSSRSSCSSLRC